MYSMYENACMKDFLTKQKDDTIVLFPSAILVC